MQAAHPGLTVAFFNCWMYKQLIDSSMIVGHLRRFPACIIDIRWIIKAEFISILSPSRSFSLFSARLALQKLFVTLSQIVLAADVGFDIGY